MAVAQIAALIATLMSPCPRCRVDADPQEFYDAASHYYVDARLLVYWGYKESSLSKKKISRLGAVGLFQVRGAHRKACEDAGLNPLGVDCGAYLIATDRYECGDLERGLNRYASGSCNGTPRSNRLVKYILQKIEKWRIKGRCTYLPYSPARRGTNTKVSYIGVHMTDRNTEALGSSE